MITSTPLLIIIIIMILITASIPNVASPWISILTIIISRINPLVIIPTRTWTRITHWWWRWSYITLLSSHWNNMYNSCLLLLHHHLWLLLLHHHLWLHSIDLNHLRLHYLHLLNWLHHLSLLHSSTHLYLHTTNVRLHLHTTLHTTMNSLTLKYSILI